MSSWWDTDESARAVLGVVDADDPAVGAGVVTLGLHGVGAAALRRAAPSFALDPGAVVTALDEVDVEPVRKAWRRVGGDDADFDLIKSDADVAAFRTISMLRQNGVAPDDAVQRAASLYGLPAKAAVSVVAKFQDQTGPVVDSAALGEVMHYAASVGDDMVAKAYETKGYHGDEPNERDRRGRFKAMKARAAQARAARASTPAPAQPPPAAPAPAQGRKPLVNLRVDTPAPTTRDRAKLTRVAAAQAKVNAAKQPKEKAPTDSGESRTSRTRRKPRRGRTASRDALVRTRREPPPTGTLPEDWRTTDPQAELSAPELGIGGDEVHVVMPGPRNSIYTILPTAIVNAMLEEGGNYSVKYMLEAPVQDGTVSTDLMHFLGPQRRPSLPAMGASDLQDWFNEQAMMTESHLAMGRDRDTAPFQFEEDPDGSIRSMTYHGQDVSLVRLNSSSGIAVDSGGHLSDVSYFAASGQGSSETGKATYTIGGDAYTVYSTVLPLDFAETDDTADAYHVHRYQDQDFVKAYETRGYHGDDPDERDASGRFRAMNRRGPRRPPQAQPKKPEAAPASPPPAAPAQQKGGLVRLRVDTPAPVARDTAKLARLASAQAKVEAARARSAGPEQAQPATRTTRSSRRTTRTDARSALRRPVNPRGKNSWKDPMAALDLHGDMEVFSPFSDTMQYKSLNEFISLPTEADDMSVYGAWDQVGDWLRSRNLRQDIPMDAQASSNAIAGAVETLDSMGTMVSSVAESLRHEKLPAAVSSTGGSEAWVEKTPNGPVIHFRNASADAVRSRSRTLREVFGDVVGVSTDVESMWALPGKGTGRSALETPRPVTFNIRMDIDSEPVKEAEWVNGEIFLYTRRSAAMPVIAVVNQTSNLPIGAAYGTRQIDPKKQITVHEPEPLFDVLEHFQNLGASPVTHDDDDPRNLDVVIVEIHD